jgi:hypothetical protein
MLERQKHKLQHICHHLLPLLLSNTLYCFPCFSLLVVYLKLQPQIIMKYEGYVPILQFVCMFLKTIIVFSFGPPIG